MNSNVTDSELRGKGARGVLVGVAVALFVVVLAPIVVSSTHLLSWASSADGLGLPTYLGWTAVLSLDAAAAVAVGMVTVSAYRGESGGVFHLLTWLLAGASAYVNHVYGVRTPAPDDQWFTPAMSLLGPALLEATLGKFRRWARAESGRSLDGHVQFGPRWTVAPVETFSAWKTARREGITRATDAITRVRECAALRTLDGPERVRYVARATDASDSYGVTLWLLARSIKVSSAEMAAGLGVPAPVVNPETERALDNERAHVAELERALRDADAQVRELTTTVLELTSGEPIEVPEPTKRQAIEAALLLTSGDVLAAVDLLAARGQTVSPSYAYRVSRLRQADPDPADTPAAGTPVISHQRVAA